MVRALDSQQCGPGSNPGVDAIICGSSLLLVLSFAPRGFSPGTSVFPSPQKPWQAFPNSSNSTRNQVDEEHFVDVLPPNHYLFFYLFIYYLLLLGVWIPSLYLIFYFSVLGFQIKYSSCLINYFSVYGYWMKHHMPHV